MPPSSVSVRVRAPCGAAQPPRRPLPSAGANARAVRRRKGSTSRRSTPASTAPTSETSAGCGKQISVSPSASSTKDGVRSPPRRLDHGPHRARSPPGAERVFRRMPTVTARPSPRRKAATSERPPEATSPRRACAAVVRCPARSCSRPGERMNRCTKVLAPCRRARWARPSARHASRITNHPVGHCHPPRPGRGVRRSCVLPRFWWQALNLRHASGTRSAHVEIG